MVSCAIKAQHDVLHGDPRRKYFRCCRIVCPAKVAVSCVSHYSNCEFLRIRYSCGLTGHGTRDCYATSTAEFHRRKSIGGVLIAAAERRSALRQTAAVSGAVGVLM